MQNKEAQHSELVTLASPGEGPGLKHLENNSI